MKTYNIFVRSNEHARTINHFNCSRCFYTKIAVNGMDELKAKVLELRANGEHINEICTNLGTRIYL